MPVVWLALCRKVDEKRQRYAELYLSSASALDDVRSYFHSDFEMLRFAGGGLPQQWGFVCGSAEPSVMTAFGDSSSEAAAQVV